MTPSKVKHYPKCPGCGKTSTIYAMPYGLQIGSHVHGEGSEVDQNAVLVMCGECGTVVGAYRRETGT